MGHQRAGQDPDNKAGSQYFRSVWEGLGLFQLPGAAPVSPGGRKLPAVVACKQKPNELTANAPLEVYLLWSHSRDTLLLTLAGLCSPFLLQTLSILLMRIE